MINLFAILDFIKKYYKLVFVGLFVFSLFCVVFLWHEDSTLKDENGRLSNNNTALMTDIEAYRTESGKNAAKKAASEKKAAKAAAKARLENTDTTVLYDAEFEKMVAKMREEREKAKKAGAK